MISFFTADVVGTRTLKLATVQRLDYVRREVNVYTIVCRCIYAGLCQCAETQTSAMARMCDVKTYTAFRGSVQSTNMSPSCELVIGS